LCDKIEAENSDNASFPDDSTSLPRLESK